jgi:hypothetical protein
LLIGAECGGGRGWGKARNVESLNGYIVKTGGRPGRGKPFTRIALIGTEGEAADEEKTAENFVTANRSKYSNGVGERLKELPKGRCRSEARSVKPFDRTNFIFA